VKVAKDFIYEPSRIELQRRNRSFSASGEPPWWYSSHWSCREHGQSLPAPEPSHQPLLFAQYSNKAEDGDDYGFAVKGLVVQAIPFCSQRKEYEQCNFACDGTEGPGVRSIT
jgi:hypothetical protein